MTLLTGGRECGQNLYMDNTAKHTIPPPSSRDLLAAWQDGHDAFNGVYGPLSCYQGQTENEDEEVRRNFWAGFRAAENERAAVRSAR